KEVAAEGVHDARLWRACMRELGYGRGRTHSETEAFARQWNAEHCSPPQPEGDLMHAVDSAWERTTSGRNWFGRPGVHFFSEEVLPLIDNDPDLFRLISFVKAMNRPGRPFMLTNTMHERWGWSRPKFAAVRARAMAAGFFCRVRSPSPGKAALYVLENRRLVKIEGTDSI